MKSDTYKVVSLARSIQASNWRNIQSCLVVNMRTGTRRYMSLGQIDKRKKQGSIRIDERIFMLDRLKNGIKQ